MNHDVELVKAARRLERVLAPLVKAGAGRAERYQDQALAESYLKGMRRSRRAWVAAVLADVERKTRIGRFAAMPNDTSTARRIASLVDDGCLERTDRGWSLTGKGYWTLQALLGENGGEGA